MSRIWSYTSTVSLKLDLSVIICKAHRKTCRWVEQTGENEALLSFSPKPPETLPWTCHWPTYYARVTKEQTDWERKSLANPSTGTPASSVSFCPAVFVVRFSFIGSCHLFPLCPLRHIFFSPCCAEILYSLVVQSDKDEEDGEIKGTSLLWTDYSWPPIKTCKDQSIHLTQTMFQNLVIQLLPWSFFPFNFLWHTAFLDFIALKHSI